VDHGILDEYYPFPPGKWLVELQGIDVMGFEGEDLHPTEFGLFMTHRPMDENHETRHSFVPWAKVKRAYTVREP
jgi:hypothetical protein